MVARKACSVFKPWDQHDVNERVRSWAGLPILWTKDQKPIGMSRSSNKYGATDRSPEPCGFFKHDRVHVRTLRWLTAACPAYIGLTSSDREPIYALCRSKTTISSSSEPGNFHRKPHWGPPCAQREYFSKCGQGYPYRRRNRSYSTRGNWCCRCRPIQRHNSKPQRLLCLQQ